MKIIRQGDVVLTKLQRSPNKAKLQPVEPSNGRVVLAYGEVTGHHHSFAFSERVSLFREDGSGGGLFLIVTGNAPVELEHQEHGSYWRPDGTRYNTTTDAGRRELSAALAEGPVRKTGDIVEPGTYRVDIQREYHPQAIRNVSD